VEQGPSPYQAAQARNAEEGMKKKFRPGFDWSDEELAIMKANYYSHPIKKMMDLLPGRRYHSIATKAREMKLRSGPDVIKLRGRKLHLWSGQEIATLKRIYADASTDELRAALGPKRNLRAIHKQAERWGLKRSPEGLRKSYEAGRRHTAEKNRKKAKTENNPDPVQTVRIVQAPRRDDAIVVKALQRRIALEMAWGGSV
jgi:hypothetical protein